MSRIEIFRALRNDIHFGPLVKKLSKTEQGQCEAFLRDYENLAFLDFEVKASRWFLDNPNKPKNWTLMIELVTCANGKFNSKNPAAVALGKLGGKVGGKSTSRSKVLAAKENGKLGGRPKAEKPKKPVFYGFALSDFDGDRPISFQKFSSRDRAERFLVRRFKWNGVTAQTDYYHQIEEGDKGLEDWAEKSDYRVDWVENVLRPYKGEK